MADMKVMAAKMKVLRDAYAAQLPDKLALLNQVWSSLPSARWDEAGFNTLHRMVHSLSGSAKTFGFSGLGEAARSLELELNKFSQDCIAPDEAQRQYVVSMLGQLQRLSRGRDSVPDEAGALAPSCSPTLRRIYIVDDEVLFAEGLSNQLGYFGYEVSVFHTLEDFRRAIADNADAVVVMDIAFPGDKYGGVCAMQEVQQGRELPIPVVYLSAYDEIDARLGAVRAGGIAYFNKPLNLATLIDKLDELTLKAPAVPYRVMIIDDSATLTAYCAAVLEQAGMKTLAVNDPLAVLKPMHEFMPDLILIDMYMPGCSGMELAKVIRQLEAFVSIPIVFLSAEQDVDKQLAAMDLGGMIFLPSRYRLTIW